MNESDKTMDEELDRLLAWLRVDTAELPTPDPGLPARIRVLAVHTNATAHERPRRWVLASLAVAVLMLVAGTGAYVGLGVAFHSPTRQQSNDADVFITALSQSGFGDEISRLHSEDQE